MLKICEIFYSIQGESSYNGYPCIFVRFSGCNLNCRYCDTKYHIRNPIEKTIPAVVKEISKYEPCRLVQITGGEPLIQDEIYQLLPKINPTHNILLETNGSVLLDKIPEYVHVIVDFKGPSSGEEQSFKLENLHFLKKGKDELKFLIRDRKDFDFALEKIRDYDLTRFKLLFSPVITKKSTETGSNKITSNLAQWILETKLPIRYQIQLHKVINVK